MLNRAATSLLKGSLQPRRQSCITLTALNHGDRAPAAVGQSKLIEQVWKGLGLNRYRVIGVGKIREPLLCDNGLLAKNDLSLRPMQCRHCFTRRCSVRKMVWS